MLCIGTSTFEVKYTQNLLLEKNETFNVHTFNFSGRVFDCVNHVTTGFVKNPGLKAMCGILVLLLGIVKIYIVSMSCQSAIIILLDVYKPHSSHCKIPHKIAHICTVGNGQLCGT